MYIEILRCTSWMHVTCKILVKSSNKWFNFRKGIRPIAQHYKYPIHMRKPSRIMVDPSFLIVLRMIVNDILEEGGDDVKSAWHLWSGSHTCYNGKQGCKVNNKSWSI
ncbi:hypothetical protein L2E82_16461 [Cichorium intybus]|uniref:Uncharacterized protein n=1 Tax=Cichorium intybus TaxID=13427 RepID=A0ACB9F540_CICIN|nr:hypothetical protein L2E82_16461 [Cichorium intybus]